MLYVSNTIIYTYIRTSIQYYISNTSVPTLTATNQNFIILSTQRTVLECLPSNRNLSVNWVLYRTDGSRIPIITRGINEEFKRNVQLLPDIEIELPFRHRINITNADVSFHSGVYECSIETLRGDTTFISRNITVNVLPGQL